MKEAVNQELIEWRGDDSVIITEKGISYLEKHGIIEG